MLDTGKVASTSSSLIKQIKDLDSSDKSSKISKDSVITGKLLHDFPEIKAENKNYKNRLQNISNELANYENELSKNQFVEEKVKSIAESLKNNDSGKANDILNNTLYNGEKVLKQFFSSDKTTLDELEKVIKSINARYDELNTQFKTIEVKSQNIISLYSYPAKINDKTISNLNVDEIVNSTKLNQKRVLDLIS
jgi:hypothetical protein